MSKTNFNSFQIVQNYKGFQFLSSRDITPSILVRYLTVATQVNGSQPASMGHFLPYSERKNFCWVDFDVILKIEEDNVSSFLQNILQLHVRYLQLILQKDIFFS